jgi:hypothetical protein
LFSGLKRLDFIKCDFVGYEVQLFPSLMSTISRFRPVIQVELNTAESRRAMSEMLKPLGYEPLRLAGDTLLPIQASALTGYEGGDFYFKAS